MRVVLAGAGGIESTPDSFLLPLSVDSGGCTAGELCCVSSSIGSTAVEAEIRSTANAETDAVTVELTVPSATDAEEEPPTEAPISPLSHMLVAEAAEDVDMESALSVEIAEDPTDVASCTVKAAVAALAFAQWTWVDLGRLDLT